MALDDVVLDEVSRIQKNRKNWREQTKISVNPNEIDHMSQPSGLTFKKCNGFLEC